ERAAVAQHRVERGAGELRDRGVEHHHGQRAAEEAGQVERMAARMGPEPAHRPAPVVDLPGDGELRTAAHGKGPLTVGDDFELVFYQPPPTLSQCFSRRPRPLILRRETYREGHPCCTSSASSGSAWPSATSTSSTRNPARG